MMLLSKTNTSFRVQATSSVYAFSYIAVVMTTDDMQVGEIALMYMPAGVIV